MGQNSVQDAIRRFCVYVIHGIYPLLRTYLLAKFRPRALCAFVENKAISSWAVSKWSTYTELETDVSRNSNFQLYYTYRRIT